jgi:hypothetical protein
MSGLKEMLISNDSDGGDGQWAPYKTNREWILEPNDLGIATVYVVYRDADGNDSAQYHATISITAAPEPTDTPTIATPTLTPTESNGGPTETPTQSSTPSTTPSPTWTPTCAIGMEEFDVIGNGQIDASDLIEILRSAREGTPIHDFNCDGTMDWRDIVIFSAEWKTQIH